MLYSGFFNLSALGLSLSTQLCACMNVTYKSTRSVRDGEPAVPHERAVSREPAVS
jgi:hypothetical protein